MYGEETVCTVTTQPPRRGTEATPTVRIRPFRWKPPFRVTRAHLMLARRPSLHEAAAQFLNACGQAISEQLGAPLSLRGELTPSWVNPFDGLSRFSAFALLDLSAVGTLACLEIDALTLGAVLSRIAGSLERPALPLSLTRLEEAAFGWMLLLAIEALRGQPQLDALLGARLLSVHTNRTEVLEKLDCRKRHLVFQARTDLEGTRGCVRLVVPSLAVERACHGAEETLRGTMEPEVGAARIAARVMVGRSPLSLTDLRSLTAGDVVVFDGTQARFGAIAGPARIESKSFELYGALTPQGFTFNHAITCANPKEPTMPNPADPSLPVEVEIELTRLQLPIAELATLKPGAVLPLHINASQPVMLRIGDRAVARAEIVEIDGELGARILTLQK
jgi:type III secretion protein Q